MNNTNTRRGYTQINWVGQAQPCGAGADNALAKGHLAAVKQNCHSQKSLLGIFRILSSYVNKGESLLTNNPDVEDPRQKSSGMTPNLMGFTLIELLVVVLIISILAAVAVPQYQLAVDKSRYIQLITMITSIKKAQEIHYLATGEYTNRFNQLDIDLPPGATVEINNKVQKEKLHYPNNLTYDISISKTTGYDDNTGMRLIYNYDHASEYSEGSANELLCYGVPNDTRRQRVCKSFGGTPIEEGSRFFRLPK